MNLKAAIVVTINKYIFDFYLHNTKHKRWHWIIQTFKMTVCG